MAIRYAIASGNWSAVGTWDGGVSLPTVGDDVYANGFTVTLDQDIEVTKISTEVCPTTSVGGGGFNYTNVQFTLICDIVAGSSICVTHSSATNKLMTIIGNIYGSNTTPSMIGLKNLGGNPCYFNITGNIYAGTELNAHGFQHAQTYGACNVTMIGDVISTTNAYGLVASTVAYLYVDLIGALYPSATIPAIGYFNSLNMIGLAKRTAVFAATSRANSITATISGVYYIVDGEGSIGSYTTGRILHNFNEPIVISIETGANSFDIYSADAFDQPGEENVRLGTDYASATLTGTLAVPDPSLVNKGVPTDDTIGTYELSGDIISRLENCSTVAITGQQIASYNGAPAELIPYNDKRYDYMTGPPDLMYLGTAPVGTLDSSTVWNLTKIVLAIDGSITSETYATDSWDNHLTASYS